jgi:hypothetical protein
VALAEQHQCGHGHDHGRRRDRHEATQEPPRALREGGRESRDEQREDDAVAQRQRRQVRRRQQPVVHRDEGSGQQDRQQEPGPDLEPAMVELVAPVVGLELRLESQPAEAAPELLGCRRIMGQVRPGLGARHVVQGNLRSRVAHGASHRV